MIVPLTETLDDVTQQQQYVDGERAQLYSDTSKYFVNLHVNVDDQSRLRRHSTTVERPDNGLVLEPWRCVHHSNVQSSFA